MKLNFTVKYEGEEGLITIPIFFQRLQKNIIKHF